MSKNHRLVPVLMYFLIAFGGIVVDIIVPSLPSIQKAFASTEVLTQWAFTAAMIGFGVGQFFAGFIVDALGRKKPMLIGGALLVASLFLTTTVPSIQLVILLRVIQGLSVSLVCVGGRAVIKDIYHGEEYLKAVNWITISFAVGITMSPFVGAYIQDMFGWQMVFEAVGACVFIGTLLLSVTYKETHTNQQPIRYTTIKSNLAEMFSDSRFLRSAIICGVFYSILPAFNTVSPFLVQNQLGYSPVFYGYIALFLAACWLLGNSMNIILFRVSAATKTTVSLSASFIATLISAIYLWLNGLNLYVFVAPVAVIISSLGMLFPLYLGRALAPFNHIAGVANATVFSGSWIATAIISFAASSLPSTSAEPLLIMYLVLIVFVLAIKGNVAK
ncbi:MFS transporter [Vibrio marisflavi]|uniref:Bicyclomycin resistance protein n=1 Tax=Vibrio marisflavi CECT 7928 TaxID=634439 RepID=A0ABM9A1L1_9VIBR|nr:MFS transporter [Vibrio marisflavi]CAH0536931.1 Bicyclomycin resistance protein [Vibrio marisflavi CECT 7928]